MSIVKDQRALGFALAAVVMHDNVEVWRHPFRREITADIPVLCIP